MAASGGHWTKGRFVASSSRIRKIKEASSRLVLHNKVKSRSHSDINSGQKGRKRTGNQEQDNEILKNLAKLGLNQQNQQQTN